MGSISGGKNKSTNTSTSSASSHSENSAFPFLLDTFGGAAQQQADTTDLLTQLLGAGDINGAANAGFNSYKDSTGYKTILDEGLKGVTNNAATSGLLNSGATAKAVTKYGTGLAAQTFDGYLSKLLGLGQLGLSAGNIISGAGQTSTSSANSSGTGSSSGKNMGVSVK